MLYGFDVEGPKFSLEYVKEKFDYLNKKANLMEIPVYVFIKRNKIDSELLKYFLDLSSSYDFKFTAHADDFLNVYAPFKLFSHEKKRALLNIKIAEKIGAKKIVFHQKHPEGEIDQKILRRIYETNVVVTFENTREINPFYVKQTTEKYDIGMTLDISHMFLYYVDNGLKISNAYSDIKYFEPEHLHIGNTYLGTGNILDSFWHIFKGDFSAAFTNLRGDYHLPLRYGHIDFRKVFRNLKIPETIIMEISTTNYSLLMKTIGKKDKIEKGYEDDIKMLKSLIKMKEKLPVLLNN